MYKRQELRREQEREAQAPAPELVAREGVGGCRGEDEPYGRLLYTSDAADELLCVDLGGRRIHKKNKKKTRPL